MKLLQDVRRRKVCSELDDGEHVQKKHAVAVAVVDGKRIAKRKQAPIQGLQSTILLLLFLLDQLVCFLGNNNMGHDEAYRKYLLPFLMM